MDDPELDLPGAEQPRPQPGHLGGADPVGGPKTLSTQSIPDRPYHNYDALLGLKGIFVDDPDQVGAAWNPALASDRPVVLPPLPPHVTLDQAKKFAMSVPPHPERGNILRNVAREVLASVLPSKR